MRAKVLRVLTVLALLGIVGTALAATQYNVHIQMPEDYKYSYTISGDTLTLKVEVPLTNACDVGALASRVGDNHFAVRFILKTPKVLPPQPVEETPASPACTPPGGTKTITIALKLNPAYPDVYITGTVAPILWGPAPNPQPAPNPVPPMANRISEMVSVKFLAQENGKYRFDYSVQLPEGAVLNDISFYCNSTKVYESQDASGSFETGELCPIRAELEYRLGGSEEKLEGTVFTPITGKEECLVIEGNLFRYRFELTNCQQQNGGNAEQCKVLEQKLSELQKKAEEMGCGNVYIGTPAEGCSGAIIGDRTISVGEWTVHLDAEVPTAVTAANGALKVIVCPEEMLRNACQSATIMMEHGEDDHYKITVRYNLEVPPGKVCAQVVRKPEARRFTITPSGKDVYIDVEWEMGRAPLPWKKEINAEELKKMIENCIKGECKLPQPKMPEINVLAQNPELNKDMKIIERITEEIKRMSEVAVVKKVEVQPEGNTIVMKVQAEIQKKLFGIIPVHIPAVVEAENDHVKTEVPWWAKIVNIFSW